MGSLKIENLHVSREGKEIVKGVSLEILMGEVHALMGPNGAGKSSLANALMGHPKYIVTHGKIILDGEDITALPPNEKAKRGLFLSMQYPPEVSGVTVAHFLRIVTAASRQRAIGVAEFRTLLKEKMKILKIDPAFLLRGFNEGFSGGEKKRMEILQLVLLEPKYAVLDETDSGLDIDALKIVTDGISTVRGTQMGIIVITHRTHILDQLHPDRVHVLADGIIVASGGKELAEKVEKEGYTFLKMITPA